MDKPKVEKSRWRGIKNFFGRVGSELKPYVTNASVALQTLSNEARASYSELKLDNDGGIVKRAGTQVWKKLVPALKALKELSETTDERDCNGKGREFANYVFTAYEGNLKYDDLDEVKKFDTFGQHVEILQLIANRTPSSSSIPSWIHQASNNTTKFFAYARAYFEYIKKTNNVLKLLTANELNGLQDDLNSFANKVKSDIESITRWEKRKEEVYANTMGKIKKYLPNWLKGGN